MIQDRKVKIWGCRGAVKQVGALQCIGLVKKATVKEAVEKAGLMYKDK
jgi:hypothetical protein